MSKSLVTCSKLHHFGKHLPDKLDQIWFFYWVRTKKILAELSNCLLRIQRSFWKKKIETTKKQFPFWMINYPILCKYFFVRVAKTAWYESIGTFCEKYLQEAMSHYFSFLQFWSNKFSVWCWNGILRVQRKRLSSFFWNFRRHFPDFEQPFLRKNARTGFHVISDTFCKKRQKTSILGLLTGFQEQYFGRVDKTTFHLSRSNFWKQNDFCRKLTLWSF